MKSKSVQSLELRATECPVCHTTDNAIELYPARLSEAAFNPETFSARRLPDRVHYRVVRCKSCGLVRSDPVADPRIQAELYAKASFDYGEEVGNLRATYGRYLAKLTALGAGKGALLEIGGGNGFLLQEALAQGYAQVTGVEPSAAAIASADPAILSHIVCDLMRPGLFAAGQFDVVCMFQTFDHITDPNALLDECFRVLNPGGFLLCLNHNIDAYSARLLGERSPIVDVEHPFLYSLKTMARVARAHGFQVADGGPAHNRVTVRYLAWLAPLPGIIKQRALAWLKDARVGRLTISVPLGNLYFIARKPGGEERS
jgi:SAM-dependent methyltransferase